MKKFVLFLAVATLTVACSRDNDNVDLGSTVIQHQPVNDGKVAEYVVSITGSAGVKIVGVGVHHSDGDDTYSGLIDPKASNTWSRKYTASSIRVNVEAVGVDEQSTLKVQITKAGKLVREANAKGGNLIVVLEH